MRMAMSQIARVQPNDGAELVRVRSLIGWFLSLRNMRKGRCVEAIDGVLLELRRLAVTLTDEEV